MLILTITNDLINEGLCKILVAENYTVKSLGCINDLEKHPFTKAILITNKYKKEQIEDYINKQYLKTIILIDSQIDRSTLNLLIKNEVNGLLSINSTKEEILRCLGNVSSGEKYYSDEISSSLHKNSLKAIQFEISERETEILDYLAKGNTLAEISDILFLSKNTVITHKRNILKKTGFNKTTQLIAWWSGNS